MSDKPKILILCDYYLPGYKSGGGMRTIVNMVARLHSKFDFSVITRDHDGRKDKKQYASVKINNWNMVENAQVYYLSRNKVKISKIRELILSIKPDAIYINSYFATFTIYVLKLRNLRLIPDINIILAPCGELSEGALQLKPGKKRLFIFVSSLFGLYKNIIWKASTNLEKSEIIRVKGKGGKVFVAPDLPPRTIIENYRPELKPEKRCGEAKLAFLARFYPKKNFKWLLNYLNKIEGNLCVDIYGPLEDEDYWQKCHEIIETLPSNVKVKSKGSIPHEKAFEVLLQYHFFILPTLGENFGHVFLEALACGCPLIISNRTPWLNLEEKGIGWDLALENPEKWIDTLNYCVDLDSAGYSKLSSNARSFAVRWLNGDKIEENTLAVLNYSLRKTRSYAK